MGNNRVQGPCLVEGIRWQDARCTDLVTNDREVWDAFQGPEMTKIMKKHGGIVNFGHDTPKLVLDENAGERLIVIGELRAKLARAVIREAGIPIIPPSIATFPSERLRIIFNGLNPSFGDPSTQLQANAPIAQLGGRFTVAEFNALINNQLREAGMMPRRLNGDKLILNEQVRALIAQALTIYEAAIKG